MWKVSEWIIIIGGWESGRGSLSVSSYRNDAVYRLSKL